MMPRLLKPLAMAVTSDTAPEVRISAVRGLADTERDEAIPGISEALADTDPTVRDTAEDALTGLGAEITTLENGGRLVVKNEAVKALVGGVSTAQAAAPTRIPVFEARGSANTRYFRTAVGDVYQNGVWRSSNVVELPYQARQGTSDLVNRLLPDHLGNLSTGNPNPQSASLAWPTSAFGLQSFEDRITVSSASADPLPAGRGRSLWGRGTFQPMDTTGPSASLSGAIDRGARIPGRLKRFVRPATGWPKPRSPTTQRLRNCPTTCPRGLRLWLRKSPVITPRHTPKPKPSNRISAPIMLTRSPNRAAHSHPLVRIPSIGSCLSQKKAPADSSAALSLSWHGRREYRRE